MLRRIIEAPIEEPSLRAAETPASCLPHYCLEAGRLASREVIDHTEEYERLVEAADAFYNQQREIEAGVAQLKLDWFSYIEENDTDTRNSRRSFRRTKEQQFGTVSQDAFEEVRGALESSFGPEWDAIPARLEERKKFNNFFGHLHKKEKPPHDKINMKNLEKVGLFDAHYKLATSQLLARGELALFYCEAPDAAQALFQPDNLSSLPVALQRLAALDISKDEASVILNHQLATDNELGPELSSGERLMQYLSSGNATKEAKAFFKAVRVGAAATGATTCPFNEFGLCRQVLERIDLRQLPPQIVADIERREKFGRHNDRPRFDRFAKSIRLGLYDPTASIVSGIEIEPSPRGNGPKRQKQTDVAPKTADLIQNGEADIRPARLQVGLLGGEPITIDTDDGAAFDKALDQLLATKLFGDYMKKHHFNGMSAFMRQALSAILQPDGRRGGSGIKPLVDAQPLHRDGIKLQVCELAVQQHHGLHGGRTARNTRILFAQGGVDGVRKLLLLDVQQKEDVKKRNLLRAFR